MSEQTHKHRWAIILAGGDGPRLKPLTSTLADDDRPKQFCAIFGERTLLEQTQRRVALLFNPTQTLTVVTRTHEPFYQEQMNNTEEQVVKRQYSEIISANFSKEVLAQRPRDLSVLQLSGVGWTDLGEPQRVVSTLQSKFCHRTAGLCSPAT